MIKQAARYAVKGRLAEQEQGPVGALLARLGAAAMLAGAIAMLPGAAGAQAIEGMSISPGATLLQVSATGTSEAKPDIASFSAGIVTRAPTAEQALAENSAKMRQVFKALTDSGIAPRDIQTSNLSISPLYARRNNDGPGYADENRRITGYKVQNTVMVKQRKIGRYGAVIDLLVKAGANQVSGPNFGLDKPEAAQDEARKKAMAAARSRAALYASATGLTVKRIVSISESGGYGGPMPPVMLARAYEADSAAPVAAGELDITVSVSVAFELAPS